MQVVTLISGQFLREGRWSEQYACYTVTKCILHHGALLSDSISTNIILSSYNYFRKTGSIRLLAFCIMPDHYHILFFLTGAKSLSELMNSIGKYTARELNQLHHRRGQFWEEGFYDHRCRNEDDIVDGMSYIEHNPVRAGLVATAEEWLFSSANPLMANLLDRNWYATAK